MSCHDGIKAVVLYKSQGKAEQLARAMGDCYRQKYATGDFDCADGSYFTHQTTGCSITVLRHGLCVLVIADDILNAIARPPQGPKWGYQPRTYFYKKIERCDMEQDLLRWVVVIRWMRDTVIGTQCRGYESRCATKVS